MMKPETSLFIDKQAKVKQIANMLGLSLPYVKRTASDHGTYYYQFKKPAKLTIQLLRDSLATFAKDYPQVVAIVNGAGSTVMVELDARDPKYRGKMPEPRWKVDGKLQQAMVTKDVRCFKIWVCGHGEMLCQSFNLSDITVDLEKQGKKIHAIREVNPMEYIVLILSGNYEAFQTDQVVKKLDDLGMTPKKDSE